MKNYYNIRISLTSKKLLENLQKRLDRNRMDIIEECLQFFESTGYDPAGHTKSPEEELKKLRDSLVSFIRTQEKKILVPMAAQVDALTLKVGDYMSRNSVELPVTKKPKVTEKPLEKVKVSVQEMSEPSASLQAEKQALQIRLEKAEKENKRLKNHLRTLKERVKQRKIGFSDHYVIEASREEIQSFFDFK
ncbi:BfmA/BtgA family mobilization protein [Flexithrix dorotheae]|uniref:BfmA/BtgA family mobilization protein n=1 Tax=Flexithrix dorotheae TaxID=70993 RepID=UPI0003707EE7|nr:BfmA/BtgA family mobilization protein [Flexithrix dorotheae]